MNEHKKKTRDAEEEDGERIIIIVIIRKISTYNAKECTNHICKNGGVGGGYNMHVFYVGQEDLHTQVNSFSHIEQTFSEIRFSQDVMQLLQIANLYIHICKLHFG